MQRRNTHLSDEELLRLADGELPSRLAVQAREHLTACWECRTRMGDLERAIADFVHVHHASLDPQVPPPARSRAMLKCRMAESARILRAKHQYLFHLLLQLRCLSCSFLTLGGIESLSFHSLCR